VIVQCITRHRHQESPVSSTGSKRWGPPASSFTHPRQLRPPQASEGARLARPAPALDVSLSSLLSRAFAGQSLVWGLSLSSGWIGSFHPSLRSSVSRRIDNEPRGARHWARSLAPRPCIRFEEAVDRHSRDDLDQTSKHVGRPAYSHTLAGSFASGNVPIFVTSSARVSFGLPIPASIHLPDGIVGVLTQDVVAQSACVLEELLDRRLTFGPFKFYIILPVCTPCARGRP
jgi:hypothetical protein